MKTAHRQILALFVSLALFLLASVSPPSHASQERVIGGQEALAGAWPWMAMLVLHSESDPFKGFACGATLIAPDRVLTAAHCVIDPDRSTPYPAQTFDVIVGRTSLSDQSSGQKIGVQKITVYPGAVYGNPLNDLAILHLAGSSSLQPVILAGPSFGTIPGPPGAMTTIIGWGATRFYNENSSNNQYPDSLMEAVLPLVSNTTCLARSPYYSELTYTDNVFCAGFPNGSKAACYGDSGGPIVIASSGGGWVQLGVTSFLLGSPDSNSEYVDCSLKGSYSGYVKLGKYSGWISENTCTTIPETPVPILSLSGRTATISWKEVPHATGYRLYYAPYPAAHPIAYIDTGTTASLSATLPSGSAYYVAVQAYRYACNGGFSPALSFTVPTN